MTTQIFATIAHVIPSGRTVDFTLRVLDDDMRIVVGYPGIDDGGPDLSAYESDAAYPHAAIAAAVAEEVGYPVRFHSCADHGEDVSAYEVWIFDAAE